MGDDELPAVPEDHVARMDQACCSFRDAARFHAAYFKQLIADGLERAEALEITVGYITALSEGDE